ncbi:MAG: zf-TFIIB domain-containing protein [Terracidiphilus sp.]
MRVATGNTTLRCYYCKNVVIAATSDPGLHYLDEVFNDLHCPVCNIPLWDATLAGIKLCACKQCSGMLIPMAALEPLIEELRDAGAEIEIPSPPDPDDLHRQLSCPKCRRQFDMHFYLGGGGSVIGGCEQCLLDWLDGGVLMRIARAPHPGDGESEF